MLNKNCYFQICVRYATTGGHNGVGRAPPTRYIIHRRSQKLIIFHGNRWFFTSRLPILPLFVVNVPVIFNVFIILSVIRFIKDFFFLIQHLLSLVRFLNGQMPITHMPPSPSFLLLSLLLTKRRLTIKFKLPPISIGFSSFLILILEFQALYLYMYV